MADPIDSFGKIVPDLYYDLIARLLPGGALLAAIVFTIPKTSLLFALHRKYELWFLVFGGYVVGMLLTGVSSLLFDIVLGGLVSIANPQLANTIGGHDHYVRIEETTKDHPEYASRIGKMVAEKVCLENGIAAAALLYFFLPPTPTASELIAQLPMVSLGLVVGWVVRALALQGRVNVANKA
jgi:hypothetical protein